MSPFIAATSAAAAISAAALFALLRAPGLMLDRPNERSLHERPVPRTGGIAIAAGTPGAGAAVVPQALLKYAAMGVSALGAIALPALGFTGQLALPAAWLAILLVFAFIVDRRWERHLGQCVDR